MDKDAWDKLSRRDREAFLLKWYIGNSEEVLVDWDLLPMAARVLLRRITGEPHDFEEFFVAAHIDENDEIVSEFNVGDVTKFRIGEMQTIILDMIYTLSDAARQIITDTADKWQEEIFPNGPP